VGGGTGMVGDPSGKTEMRKMLSLEQIKANAQGIKTQLSRFLDFKDDRALLLNNADWLTKLEFIPFLRDIGRHFSVNRMIKAESYKMRLDSEEGLSFIEFNYMVLQAYDFLELYDSHHCRLQMGGSDQWGNIVAGVELIRRTRQITAFGITFPLITTSSGEKMGKTAKGAVWLDPDRTSPYEYYQYWINTDDRDVSRFLALFTFLPMEEIQALAQVTGADLNSAKSILAFEATTLAHGAGESLKAYQASTSLFGRREIPMTLLPSSQIPRGAAGADEVEMPTSEVMEADLKAGIPAYQLFHDIALANSRGAARRLIDQGGAYLNGERIEIFDRLITVDDLDDDGTMVLRAGKKRYHRIIIAS
jgi:tyrosyl-tRNA synthetase